MIKLWHTKWNQSAKPQAKCVFFSSGSQKKSKYWPKKIPNQLIQPINKIIKIWEFTNQYAPGREHEPLTPIQT